MQWATVNAGTSQCWEEVTVECLALKLTSVSPCPRPRECCERRSRKNVRVKDKEEPVRCCFLFITWPLPLWSHSRHSYMCKICACMRKHAHTHRHTHTYILTNTATSTEKMNKKRRTIVIKVTVIFFVEGGRWLRQYREYSYKTV